ncbi:MAG: tetratricopeptide repeat protein [Candidatus Omnitrophota bacterium]
MKITGPQKFHTNILLQATLSCLLIMWIAVSILHACRHLRRNYPAIQVRLLDYSCPSFADLAQLIKTEGRILEKDAHKYLIYLKIVARAFPDAQADTIAGFLHAKSGNLPAAVSHFTRAKKIEKDFFWPYYNIGLIYFRTNQYAAAIESMTAALALNPSPSITVILSSRIYMQLLRDNGMETTLLLMRSVERASLHAQRIIVASLYLNGDLEQSASEATSFLQGNNSGDPDLLYWRGRAFFDMKDWKSAMASFTAIDKDRRPSEGDAYLAACRDHLLAAGSELTPPLPHPDRSAYLQKLKTIPFRFF